MQLLQDIGTNKCRLMESLQIDKESLPKGVLGVMEGICSDYTQATRNDNYYSRTLWERVLDSDYVKECLETKTLFGALDHPETLENLAGDAAVSCTRLWLDDTDQCLKGTFNVLPTPRGKILDALLKTGAILGVSCRGVGDLIPQADGTNKVDEETYNFVCFDVVTQPAATKARQKYQKLTESQKLEVKPVIDAIIESVSACKSKDELESIKNLAKRLGYDDAPIFKTKLKEQTELVENNSEEKLIQENKNLKTLNDRLSKDVETAYKKVKVLESSVDRTTIAADMSYLRTQISKLSKLLESKDNTVLDKYTQLLKDFETVSLQNNVLNESMKSQKELLDKINDLESQLKIEESKNTQLSKKLDYAVNFVNKCKTNINTLTESKKDLASQVNELTNSLTEQKKTSAELLKQKTSAETKLKESITFANKQKTLLENLKKEYASGREKSFGLNGVISNDTLNSINSLKEIDKIIVESDKKNNYAPNRSNVVAAQRTMQSNTQDKESSVLGTIMDSFHNK